MSAERLQFPGWRTREVFRRTGAWDVFNAFIELLRRALQNLHLPAREDTSIAWEDGEVHEDHEGRG